MLNIEAVPILYDGPFSEPVIAKLASSIIKGICACSGIVASNPAIVALKSIMYERGPTTDAITAWTVVFPLFPGPLSSMPKFRR